MTRSVHANGIAGVGPARRAACAGLLAAMLIAVPARAEIRRIAVVVGSNRGDAGHAPLRFAEQDAAKMSAVLGELGGIAQQDLILLRGPRVADVRAALDEAVRRVASWHADHRGQAVLFFYFSGHSDGQVLELGGDALPFSELRQRLQASGADVRLVIVDSCRSGALLALKGGTLGQPFDIRLADDLGSAGEAMIASSAADEAALESAEIGASFFSHHFVSGLRGAADLSGDGLVTLGEAYQYAFARTLRATSDTLVGPQHPAYDYHLAGRGELVLTELRHPSAAVELPGGFDRLLLVATASEQVVVEIGPRSAHRIAVPAGDYRLRAWRGPNAFVSRLHLEHGHELRISAADLQPAAISGAAVARKGDSSQRGGGEVSEAVAARASRPSLDAQAVWDVAASLGASDGAIDAAWLGMARVTLERSRGARRISLSMFGGTGRAGAVAERRAGAELLPSWWTGGRVVEVGVGLGVGSGVTLEELATGGAHWSGLGWASPTVLLEVPLEGRFALEASGALPVTLLRRDGRLAVTLLPVVWFGLARAF